MQLTFDKYTITGTAQELADYVSAYENKSVFMTKNLIIDNSGNTTVNSNNPSGM